jgi:predicted phage terminase large subunit-like protein
MRIIAGSYSSDLSIYLASQRQRLVKSDKFKRLFPDITLSTDGKEMMATDKGGYIVATSTGGSITGFHAHIIVIDDPINPKQAVSKVMVQTANDWFDHTLSTRKVDKAITPMVLIMQRLNQDDPTGHILTQYDPSTLRHICLPATVQDNVRPRQLKHMYIDGLLDPRRMSRTVLKEQELRLGTYGYAGQFDQRPVPAGGATFKTEAVKLCDHAPALVKSVRYWDKAISISKGACFTAGVLLGQTSDKQYVVADVVRGQWPAEERERIIKNTAILDGRRVPVAVEQEPGSSGKESAQNTIRNLAGWRVIRDRPTGDKETRAYPFASQLNDGFVSVVDAPWARAYLEELRFFPAGKWKDQVDATSGAFGILTRSLRLGALGGR